MGSNDDPHLPAIDALVAQGDWVGLAGYSIGHRHANALQRAELMLGRRIAQGETFLAEVRAFVRRAIENPWDTERRAPLHLWPMLKRKEQMTLAMLVLTPLARACERVREVPIAEQTALLKLSFEMATSGLRLARELGNPPLEAYFQLLVGRASSELGSDAAALKAYCGAVEIYRRLLPENRPFYSHALTTSLSNLGVVQSQAADWSAARTSLTEALELLADGADGGDVVVGHDERAHAPHASGSFGSKRDVGGSGSEARRQRSSHLSHRRSLVEVRAKQV